MLTENEINRLLNREKNILADKDILKDAESWDFSSLRLNPMTIATVYSYMKHQYETGLSLGDMEKQLGVAMELISFALRDLEAHGYLAISRSTKPFVYRVIK
jgi:hypothetical protein